MYNNFQRKSRKTMYSSLLAEKGICKESEHCISRLRYVFFLGVTVWFLFCMTAISAQAETYYTYNRYGLRSPVNCHQEMCGEYDWFGTFILNNTPVEVLKFKDVSLGESENYALVAIGNNAVWIDECYLYAQPQGEQATYPHQLQNAVTLYDIDSSKPICELEKGEDAYAYAHLGGDRLYVNYKDITGYYLWSEVTTSGFSYSDPLDGMYPKSAAVRRARRELMSAFKLTIDEVYAMRYEFVCICQVHGLDIYNIWFYPSNKNGPYQYLVSYDANNCEIRSVQAFDGPGLG